MARVAVMAVFRPAKNKVAVFVGDAANAGDQRMSIELEVDEARQIHGALGQALRLADQRGDPVGAVESSSDRPPANRCDL